MAPHDGRGWVICRHWGAQAGRCQARPPARHLQAAKACLGNRPSAGGCACVRGGKGRHRPPAPLLLLAGRCNLPHTGCAGRQSAGPRTPLGDHSCDECPPRARPLHPSARKLGGRRRDGHCRQHARQNPSAPPPPARPPARADGPAQLHEGPAPRHAGAPLRQPLHLPGGAAQPAGGGQAVCAAPAVPGRGGAQGCARAPCAPAPPRRRRRRAARTPQVCWHRGCCPTRPRNTAMRSSCWSVCSY